VGRREFMKRIVLWLTGTALMTALLACESEQPPANTCAPDLGIAQVVYSDPVLMGTRFTVNGTGFDESCGSVTMRFSGYYGGTQVDVDVIPLVESLNRITFTASAGFLGQLGSSGSVFSGNIVVRILKAGFATNEAFYPVQFEVGSALQPILSMVNPMDVTLYAPVTTWGGGYIHGDEGTSHAVLEGIFTYDSGGSFPVTGVETPIYLVEETDRTRGYFHYVPDIAGISPGTFVGSVYVVNRHTDGTVLESGSLGVTFILGSSFVTGLSPVESTLGGILTIEGAGFIGATTEETLTFLVEGTAYPYGGDPQTVAGLELIGRFLDGGHVQYDIIPTRIDNRLVATDFGFQRGSFVGTVTPVLEYRSEQIYGFPTDVTFTLGPMKQVGYVQFQDSFSRTLREFGLRPVESYVREAILEKMRRAYEDVNVEFRSDWPEDYYPGGYSIIEITGPDPNGKGIFGYDNTPGKDVWNLRIHDRIGGVNAETQEDGFPGYGGVFIDSVLCWSSHPPDSVVCPTGFEPEPEFDRIFDPLRNDEVTAGEYPSGPDPERTAQIAEAITVFGNLIGDITAHELGHSFGLAHPYGAPDLYHNEPPGPGCLMDAGAYRPFDERTELFGARPGSWCGDEGPYLETILPLN
jgi:hypothetical protein